MNSIRSKQPNFLKGLVNEDLFRNVWMFNDGGIIQHLRGSKDDRGTSPLRMD